MRNFSFLALLACCAVHSGSRAEEPKGPPQQFMISLKLTEVGEDAIEKVLAEPRLVTVDGRPASFVAGGQLPIKSGKAVEYVMTGIVVKVEVRSLKEDKVRLDVSVEDRQGEKTDDESVLVETRGVRAVRTVRLDEKTCLTERKDQRAGKYRLEVKVQKVGEVGQ